MKPWDDLPVLQTRSERIARLEIPVLAPKKREPTNRQQQRAIAERRYRMAERDRRYNGDVFTHPRGRLCLVIQCADCRQFAYYASPFHRRTYGALNGWPKRRIHWLSRGRCDECEENDKRFTPIERCTHCGRFKKAGQSGVTTRRDCYDNSARHDYSLGPPQRPTLCVGCWNRERPIWARWRDAEETRRALNALKRAISNSRSTHEER